MTDCKGLFGKIFGHDFKKYIVRPKIYGITEITGLQGIKETLPYLQDLYEIRCKRCGNKPKDGDEYAKN